MTKFSDISRKDRSLRPYQQKAKEEIFSAWDEFANVMFQMPTGTGKTRLFTSMISDIKAWGIINSLDPKVLIIAHRVELIEQISENLERYKIPHGLIAGGKNRDLRKSVQVASIQTITHHNNLDVASELNVDFIIIDEAHHSMANSYKKLWSLYPDAKKLGVTATPWRMNNRGFKSIYDKIILSQPIKDFIDEGWLAPYSYFSIKSSSEIKRDIHNINDFDVEGDYKISALENVMDNNTIRAQLLKSYNKFAKGKKGIIYSISRKHSDHICEEFRNAGINIVKIDSQTPRDERRLYVNRFKEGYIDIIVNVDIFSEGFDCPDIEFIQLARPTRSLVKYLQQVGRGLRPTKGKNKCIILDNVGSHFEFGLPDTDRDWNDFFIGVPSCSTHSSIGNSSVSHEYAEKSYDEGDDELCLIENIEDVKKEEIHEEKVIDIWSEKDDELIRTLYIEKHCSPEIMAMVFSKDAEVINERIKSLGLDSDGVDKTIL